MSAAGRLSPAQLTEDSGKDHVTNMEVLSRTGQRRLQDIVAERRLRMAGHIIRIWTTNQSRHVMDASW